MTDYYAFGKKVAELLREINFEDAETSDLKRSNANINGNTPAGRMLQSGSEIMKIYYNAFCIDPVYAQAHKSGDIHIHDQDYYATTTTCVQTELAKVLEKGFNTGDGSLRAPKNILSAGALAAISLQSSQNLMFGGQAICDFDYAMAKYVKLTYEKYFNETPLEPTSPAKWERYVWDKTRKDTYQAAEAFVHNMNTLHSRAGNQVVFSSVNFGTDTSKWGRLWTEQFLLAIEAGLGNGETAIFPISIFRVKEGINYNPDDPNYDLFKLAIRVSAKRLFPNFLFIDAPFNLQYYKPGHPETEIATMGCRTRVIGNVNDPTRQIPNGRGNLSFTTINLPRLGIESHGNLNAFYYMLDDKLNLVYHQLMERFELQAQRKAKDFPFLYLGGVWMDGETLRPDDEIREVLKHGTLSIGFIGLAECLKALVGSHHGESFSAQALGLQIIAHMRDFCDKKSRETKMNITLLATPAEGLSGRFTKLDKERYGVIEGITDKDYYTNSFHVPVYYKIGAVDKIRTEAPYHALTNAGHISYIEMDGDPSQNLEAFEKIVRVMKEYGIGYGSINHPVDRDPVCGYNGIIGDECPQCGRQEGTQKFERIRRITGYLVGTLDRWNDAKQAEERDRVKHG